MNDEDPKNGQSPGESSGQPSGPSQGRSSNLDLVRQSVRHTQLALFGGGTGAGAAPLAAEQAAVQTGKDLQTAYGAAVGKTVQSIGQTTAIVIQDAADMLRNVSTVEVTAIGAATAAWIATKQTQPYKDIIEESITVMQQAAALYLTIGQNAYTVMNQFNPGATAAPPAPPPAATPPA
jgi:Na+/citrate or Na+/malate symporter